MQLIKTKGGKKGYFSIQNDENKTPEAAVSQDRGRDSCRMNHFQTVALEGIISLSRCGTELNEKNRRTTCLNLKVSLMKSRRCEPMHERRGDGKALAASSATEVSPSPPPSLLIWGELLVHHLHFVSASSSYALVLFRRRLSAAVTHFWISLCQPLMASCRRRR